MMAVSIKKRIGFEDQSKGYTIDGCQQLFALVLPLDFGDAGLLGNFSQHMPGLVALRLEAKCVFLPVGHRRVVV
jgi:hypothetical protein